MATKKVAKAQEKQPHWLNKSEMAKSNGISVQAFDKWGVAPVARVGREAFFTVEDVLENRRQHWDKNKPQYTNLPDGFTPDLVEFEKWRKYRAEADAKELENDVTRKTQAPVALLEWGLNKAAEQISGKLDALTGVIKRKLPHLKSSEINIIAKEIAKASNSLAGIELPWDELEE